jgi:hypothetical protein
MTYAFGISVDGRTSTSLSSSALAVKVTRSLPLTTGTSSVAAEAAAGMVRAAARTARHVVMSFMAGTVPVVRPAVMRHVSRVRSGHPDP